MSSAGRPQGEYQTREEVEAAIAALSDVHRKNLRDAAAAHVWRFRLDRAEHNADDLLAEAITRTLEGRRRKRRPVVLAAHLIKTMESIASDWRRRAATRARSGFLVVRQSEYRRRLEQGGDFVDILRNAPSQEPDVERAMIAREEARAFLRHFVGDRAAILVATGKMWKMKGPQICLRFNLTPAEFAAAVKRIDRYAKRLLRARSEV